MTTEEKIIFFLMALSLIIFLWECRLIIIRIIDKAEFGDILFKTKQANSSSNIIMGMVFFVIAIIQYIQFYDSRLWSWSILIIFVITSFTYLYNGLFYIEIREKGIFLLNKILKWEDIKEFKYEYNAFKFVLSKPVIIKQVRARIRKEDVDTIKKIINNKVKK